ncbi:MAG: hypothetical protein PHS92_00810 [Candidatus Gracilibacteria bacterium]|nr:hypothetical protein [Candidatus Gracilibacteria bacterium]
MATTKIMVNTPMTIPSIDKLERSLFALRDLKDSFNISRNNLIVFQLRIGS